jgi:glycosyltransferase involved in cell wall biosynthesis
MKSHVGGGAILVDPKNESDIQEALRNALNDAELCARTIDKGRVNVHRFSGDEVARLHVQLYRELLER